MTDHATEWLQSLNLDQLNQVEKRIAEIQEKRRAKVRNPGAASANDLAAAQGLDLSGLMREIARKR